MSERLELVAPELVRRLRSAPSAHLRGVAWAAANAAVEHAKVRDTSVRLGLDAVRKGSRDESLRQSLFRLAEDLDDKYWSLQENLEEGGGSSEDQVLTAFRKARAVWSVYYGFETDLLSAALEAVYEAYSAAGEEEGTVLDAVDECLASPL